MSDSSITTKKRGRPPRDTSDNSNQAKKIAHLKELKKTNTMILRNSKQKTDIPVNKPEITAPTTSSSSVTSINNRFDPLQSDFNTSATQNEITKVVNKKKAYIPPIVIQGMDLTKFNEFIVSNKIKDYKIKLISVGIKLTLNDIIEYNNITAALKKLDLEFFSFSNYDTNPIKILLTGLPLVNIDELKDEIIIAGVAKEYILEIVPLKGDEKNHNVHKNVNYLIKFDKSKIKLQDVKKVKSLFNIIIRWFPHVNYRRGPTQCRNCQMYGHGTSHCHRKIRCKKCGENHSGLVCIIDHVKCVNCGGNHEADSKDCSDREKYVAIRQNISINRQLRNYNNRPNERSQNRFSSSQPIASNSKSQFQLKRNVNFNANNLTQFPELRHDRSNVDRDGYFKQFSSSQPISYSSMSRNQNASNNEELFSLDELTSLVSELTTQISVCSTRSQQFAVIMKLSLQYLGKSQWP